MISEKRLNYLARCGLFAASIIWGSSFFILKNTLDVFGINFILGLRFCGGSLLLCVIFCKKLKNMDLSYLKAGGIIGVLQYLGFLIQTIGLDYTTPGKNAFLTAVYCIITPFLFWLVTKRQPDKYNVISAIVCLMGIGLVSVTEEFRISLGDGLSIFSGLIYAAQIVAVAIYAKEKDPILITIVQLGVAGLLGVVGVLFTGGLPEAGTVTTGAVIEIIYLCVFSTAMCMSLQNFGQKYATASQAAIILSLESVFGVLFSLIFYGEELTPKLLTGFVLIFWAVMISETKLNGIKLTKSTKTDEETEENESSQ